MNYSVDKIAAQSYTGRVHVVHVPLNSGGYDRNGCYFGIGGRLYNVYDDDMILDYNIRAQDREDALWQARGRYPVAMIQGLPQPIKPGESEPVTFWEVETTDTFGGQANYCWVNRSLVCTPADTDKYKHRVIRMLRSAAGLTNTRARFCDHGDTIRWDWQNAAIVTFAVPRY
jgi:hypothetical protein